MNDRHNIFNSLFSLIDFRLMNDSFEFFFSLSPLSLRYEIVIGCVYVCVYVRVTLCRVLKPMRNLASLILILAHYICSELMAKSDVDGPKYRRWITIQEKLMEKNRSFILFGIRSKFYLYVDFMRTTHGNPPTRYTFHFYTRKSKGF